MPALLDPQAFRTKIQAEANTDPQLVKEGLVCEQLQELGPCTLMGSDSIHLRVSRDLADVRAEVTVIFEKS